MIDNGYALAESYSDSTSVGLTSCVCNAGYAGENGGKSVYVCVRVYMDV